MKTFAELNFPGRLIAVEGLDGSGKSTQIYLLKRWLELQGLKVYFSEWNSSELVKAATSKGKKRELLTPTTFSLIHATDFADRYERHLVPLLRAGYRIDALDLSPRALARLEERARAEGLGDRLRTIAGDAERLDPGGAYDLVYGVHLLHHVADRVAMLATMRRAARRGGVVVCVEPNPLNPAWYAYITLDRLRSWRVERGLLTIVPWALVRDYRRAGLSGVTRVMYGAVPIPAVNRWPGLLALEARLNRIPGLRLLCAVQIVRGVRDA